jgi:hypothetical protein
MLLRLLWFTTIFLIIIGILFMATYGLDVPEAFYERSEIVIADV